MDKVRLEHNTRVTIYGHRGIVGTVAGYALQYNENPITARQKAQERGHELWWVNKKADTLYGDRESFNHQEREWADAITIQNGQAVEIEGHSLIVKYKGNYSDMVSFQRLGTGR
tara:strand:+ start:206 stop:547 length:342 start_codon:yes stop_codon:yes gene_type:complete